MFRRLLLAVALLLGASSTVGLTGCADCHIVYLNGPGNHPPGGAYIADIQTWYTVVGGQLNLYGYSLTVDTVIWNERACIYSNLLEPAPGERPQVRPVMAR